jgi:hypothetical protein
MLVSDAQRGDEVAYETFLVELQAWLLRYPDHVHPTHMVSLVTDGTANLRWTTGVPDEFDIVSR